MIALILGAVLVVAGVVGVVVFAPGEVRHLTGRKARRRRLEQLQRYRLLGADSERQLPEADAAPSQVSVQALAVLDRAVRARGWHAGLAARLDAAGLRMAPAEWVAIQLAAVTGSAAVGAVLFRSVFGLLAGVLGWFGCTIVLSMRTRKRLAAFETQLADALQLVAGALRSGFAVNQSIAAVVREAPEPAAGEFARALQEVRIGAEIEDALDRLAARMRSSDLSLVVMAIRTVREAGGNLAETLETTVATMRERTQLRGQVKTLSAEGRLSAKVLVALPLLLAAYLVSFRRPYLHPMVTTVPGIVMLAIGVVLMVAGSFWLAKLTKIEV